MENIPENIKRIIDTSVPLDDKQTREVLKKYRSTRNPEFKKEIVGAYLKHVVSIAKRYLRHYNHHETELPDLIEEGLIGLLKAINRYNLKSNITFKKYAEYWIRNSIQNYIKQKSSVVVEMPMPTLLLLKKWVKEWQKVYKSIGSAPSLKDISGKLKISFKKAKKIAQLINDYTKVFSLDTPMEDKETTFKDVIEDKELSPDEVISKIYTKNLVDEIFCKVLTKREATILKYRYSGFDSKGLQKKLSYRTIGKILHISQEYVRKIEKKALQKIKDYLKEKI